MVSIIWITLFWSVRGRWRRAKITLHNISMSNKKRPRNTSINITPPCNLQNQTGKFHISCTALTLESGLLLIYTLSFLLILFCCSKCPITCLNSNYLTVSVHLLWERIFSVKQLFKPISKWAVVKEDVLWLSFRTKS